MWSKDQIKKHKKAAEKIKRIKNNSFNLIKEKEDITERNAEMIIREIAVEDKDPQELKEENNERERRHS